MPFPKNKMIWLYTTVLIAGIGYTGYRLDRDGDLNIAVAAAASNTFLLYLNQVRPDGGLHALNAAPGPR